MDNGTQVDIQMPIKNGAFVVGGVIDRLSLQDDVASTFFVDAHDRDLEYYP